VSKGKPGTGRRHADPAQSRQRMTLKRYLAMRERISSREGTGQKERVGSTATPRQEHVGACAGSWGTKTGVLAMSAP
jgi:hypothetical protein